MSLSLSVRGAAGEDSVKKDNLIYWYRCVSLFIEIGVFYSSVRQLTTYKKYSLFLEQRGGCLTIAYNISRM